MSCAENKADVNIQDVDMERDPRYVSKEQDSAVKLLAYRS